MDPKPRTLPREILEIRVEKAMTPEQFGNPLAQTTSTD
jgi:hypothetical protein